MDYEKKYKEVLERAKNEYQAHKSFNGFRGMLVRIFPELCESEDEKVRKEIIKFLELPHRQFVGERCQEEWIAWLEKQGKETNWKPTEVQYEALDYAFYSIPDNKRGNYYAGVLENLIEDLHRLEKQDDEKPVIEMKSAEESLGISSEKYNDIVNECLYGESNSSDKVEPKFKVGDWVVQGYNILKIKCVGDTHYCFETVSGYVDDMLISEIDSQFHLWTINDAKDGDVLVNGSNIFIFHFINGTRLMGYCHVNTNEGRFYDDIGKNECFCLIDAVVNPAAKFQRNILFVRMNEAGYEWDAEKKELKLLITNGGDFFESKNCEQNPGWSKEDEKMLNGVIDEIQANKSNAPSYDIPVYEEFLNWLKSLKQKIEG